MKRQDAVILGVIIVTYIIGLFLTIESGDILGPYTGEIGGVFGVIALAMYSIWFAWKVLKKQSVSREQIKSFVHPVPSTEKAPHGINPLLDDQTLLVKQLTRSHRLFIAHFMGTLILIPLIAIWSFLFLIAVAPPIERFIIEGLMVGIPLILLIVILWSVSKTFFYYFQTIREYLENTKKAIDTGEGDVNITAYINLLFAILRSDAPLSEEDPVQQIQQSRSHLRAMQILPIVEIAVFITFMGTMSLLFSTLGVYITNPVFQLLLGSFYLGIGGVMIVRWVVFLLWIRLLRRWLKLYVALTEWRMDLEQSFLGETTAQDEEG